MINHVLGDPRPMMKGMFIIQPIQHVENLDQIPAEQMANLGPLVLLVSKFLREELHPIRIYFCSFGEDVRHIHFLVLPRDKSMPANGRRVLQEVIEEKLWTCDVEEAEYLAGLLKTYLTENMVN